MVIIFSGFRYKIGWDYDEYAHRYNRNMFDTFAEKIWINIENVLHYLNFSAQGFFLLTSCVIYGFIFLGIKKYKTKYMIAIFNFIFIPFLYFSSLSEIRQWVSISIIFYYINYCYEKKYLKYILICIIASFFHKMAILAIVFIFLNKKIKKKMVITIFFIVIVLKKYLIYIVVYIGKFFPEYRKYFNYVGNLNYINDSTGVILSFWIMIAMIFIYSKEKVENKKSNILIFNLSSTGILILIIFFNNVAVKRVGNYFLIFSPILLAEMFALKNKVIKGLTIFIMIGYLLIFTKDIIIPSLTQKIEKNISQNNKIYNYNFKLFKQK